MVPSDVTVGVSDIKQRVISMRMAALTCGGGGDVALLKHLENRPDQRPDWRCIAEPGR